MTGLLPPTVESYLIESGFTITEIVVLHKLLEGEALTLRELAAKTGKGTGVLDKATKKLLKRGILMRETVNDKPKFVVKSLEAIQQWMKEDMEERRRYLERREQDFDTFLNSLSMDKARPEMEHFEGEEGICKAYMKLLTLSEKELLFYVPVKHKEEEDPLRAFRVQHFRVRHKRGIFSRVIAPDTALGRRYQSRDVFEYRRTVLVPEGRFPVMFEKVIAGDTIACFDHAKQSACFMRYPQMADSERRMFEREWREALESRGEEKEAPEEDEEEEVALSTATLSAIREFLLSRKSIAAFIACAILAAGVTYGLYRQNMYLNLQRVRERVMAIAATAAPEFDAVDLNELHTWRDAEKPVYEKVVRQLQDIRERNEGVVYAYIMRPTEDPYFYEFVADADSLDIYTQEDIDGDGIRDDVVAPGHVFYDYLYQKGEESALELAMSQPSADKEPFTDPWGTWISGSAPIFDRNGVAVATLGVDIDAASVKQLNKETFYIPFYFFWFFVLFIFVRLVAWFSIGRLPKRQKTR